LNGVRSKTLTRRFVRLTTASWMCPVSRATGRAGSSGCGDAVQRLTVRRRPVRDVAHREDAAVVAEDPVLAGAAGGPVEPPAGTMSSSSASPKTRSLPQPV
jgi:hypothetical protein